MTTELKTWRGKTFKDLVVEAKSDINEVTPEQVKQWLDETKDFVLIDVREPADYEKGHIEGAVLCPRGILELEIDELAPDQDATVVLQCGGGSRSALAAKSLQEMGYPNVLSMQEGWRGWASRYQ